jgi:hypothetical protein
VAGSLTIKIQKTTWRVERQAAVSAGKCTQELLSLGERKFIGGLTELHSTLLRDTVTTELKIAFPRTQVTTSWSKTA